MAEGDPLLSGDVIAAIAEADCGRDARIVELENALGDESGVEAVGERIDADRGDGDPEDDADWFHRKRIYHKDAQTLSGGPEGRWFISRWRQSGRNSDLAKG